MTITFAQARAAVQADRTVGEFFGIGFTVAYSGWHNDDAFLVTVEAADGCPIFDAPAILVDKRTGVVTNVVGLLGRPPAANLRPT